VHQNLRQQRLYIALGFNAQRNFEVQVRAHQAACKRAEEEAKKAEEAKKKTEEAKKAEEVTQTTGTNGDENGEEK
jgi:membrane protein involved in colicin uptake